jgi:radical SAM protein (TIGR04043 family)
VPVSKNHGTGNRHLAAHLQSRGLRIESSIERRKGGAGPAEGITIILNDRPLTVPAAGSFVAQSPYSLRSRDGEHQLYMDGKTLCKVAIPPPPHFYSLTTDEGIPYSSIALLHGNRCLGSTVFQNCIYWNSPRRCTFCGIELSLRNSATVQTKSPAQLSEVAMAASRLDGIEHITLTTGVQADQSEEITHLASCCSAIKSQTALPIHVQIMPPKDPGLLEMLKESGADTVGIHIESFDQAMLETMAPSKAGIDRRHFIRSWKTAVEIFGINQVSSFLIAGLGESPGSILEGAALLCDLGVYPFIVPLRPIPGTALAAQSPPDPDVMSDIYERASTLLQRSGLSWRKSKAGCVRCGACSGLPDFEGDAICQILTPLGR